MINNEKIRRKLDNQQLKVFLVTRKADWCEDHSVAV